ncbi:TIGR03790 family protein [Kiritimatiella glycovorans]|uniref:TIGR03790 family protein n=1 Tax=Kiritimatiella glycovorans TaxID=1307763 RepID=A0A0G3EDF5_9BACT|nr:TIGR03790 family protein [Kiritimatiella glycovorans]AKJ64318.1 hypothetical protein L21SP4_01064 [Kiritimatiella glycovorans]
MTDKKTALKWFAVLLVCGCTGAARAQLPGETLLLINRNSAASMKVGHFFARTRKVPFENIVYLDVPAEAVQGTYSIAPEEFTRHIWDPARAAADRRGLADHLLAWVYSVDFPIRVTASPDVSITGLTFARNDLPASEKVKKGQYLSHLFCGPTPKGERSRPPLSFARSAAGLGDRMPLPAMMLGHLGPGGSTVEQVMETLRRGARSDGSRPDSGIYFVRTDDEHRSKPREWQYAAVQTELARFGIEATTTTNFPAGEENVIGLLTGAKTVDPGRVESFAPGAVAEHLTSWAAVFERPQTKLTAWLNNGVTASAGTVTEPYNVWTKFPHARLFVMYAGGCTAMEALYQSIACPFQSLILGEPFARPWRLPVRVGVAGLPRETLDGDVTLRGQAAPQHPKLSFEFAFYVDGRLRRDFDADSTYRLPVSELNDGFHTLRVAARLKKPVVHAIEATGGFMVDRAGRSAVIRTIEGREDGAVAVTVETRSDTPPQKVCLMRGSLLLDEREGGGEHEFRFNEREVGEGVHILQAVARFEDGAEVRSAPARCEIAFPEPKPERTAEEESGGTDE